MSKKSYKNPPIIEAICEFQFEQKDSWDMTIPGLIYQKIKNDFPVKKQNQIFNLDLKATGDRIEQVFQPSERALFFSEDEKSLIQIGKNLLAINQLAPYLSWEVYKPLILTGLKAYKEIVIPEQINRISLRFINHIKIPSNNTQFKDYFNFYPYIDEKLPQTLNSFITGLQTPFNDSRDNLKIVISDIQSKNKEEMIASLELDYMLNISNSIKIEDLNEWIESAHNVLEDAFESCITDKTRALFE